jgi:hypothetical protein
MKAEPPVPKEELRRVALETMAAARFPMFASVDDDQPRQSATAGKLNS